MTTNFRSQFDLPRDVCYLNASYMTPQPRRVLDAAIRGARDRANAWRIRPDDFFDDVETLRRSFALLIDCSPDNVAIIPAASYGITTAAQNVALEPGDAVIVLSDQFPSNYYAWKRICNDAAAELFVVDKSDADEWTPAILDAIDTLASRLSIAALPQHHWATGEAVDLVEVCQVLHENGTQIMLDVTQTVGVYPVDLVALDPDFAVTAGYKWLFCPYGLSFLYVADRHLDGRPIEDAWATRAGARDFSALAQYTDEYAPGATRFDMGERASFSNVAGGIEALAFLREMGVADISRTIGDLNREVARIVTAHGFETVDESRRAPHILSARLRDTDMREITARLAADGVYVSPRGDRLRIAPHVYVDEQDLERFERSLAEALRSGQ